MDCLGVPRGNRPPVPASPGANSPAEVPHRQFVFTVPKRLRIYFRFERRLLGDPCRSAARTLTTVYRASSGRPDGVPGVVGAIQTFGQLVHWHPHIHALVTEGVLLSDHNAVRRFPEPGDEELLAGPSRNFKVFDPLDFLAEVTQHIPDPGDHLIRYYGWYSNKTRGQTAKRQPFATASILPPPRSPTARDARKGWAALIRQVYETDPLTCPKCGAQMKIVAFIERHQTDVIEKILRSRGRGMGCGTTPPPAVRRRSGWRSRAETRLRENSVGRIAPRCARGRPNAAVCPRTASYPSLGLIAASPTAGPRPANRRNATTVPRGGRSW